MFLWQVSERNDNKNSWLWGLFWVKRRWWREKSITMYTPTRTGFTLMYTRKLNFAIISINRCSVCERERKREKLGMAQVKWIGKIFCLSVFAWFGIFISLHQNIYAGGRRRQVCVLHKHKRNKKNVFHRRKFCLAQ